MMDSIIDSLLDIAGWILIKLIVPAAAIYFLAEPWIEKIS